MGFLFAKHLIAKFTERPYTAELFADIIKNPDKVESQKDRKVMASKIIDRYLHRLAYNIQDQDYILITHYQTSKISKYMNI